MQTNKKFLFNNCTNVSPAKPVWQLTHLGSISQKMGISPPADHATVATNLTEPIHRSIRKLYLVPKPNFLRQEKVRKILVNGKMHFSANRN
jgi:hypothetical protein